MAGLIQPPDIRGILDLGANIGLAARWLLARFPDAQVVGVEPDARNVQMARRNLAAADRGTRHRVIHAFAGGMSRTAFLHSSGLRDANEGVLVDAPIMGKAGVRVMTGEEICQEVAGPLDLVKIDIEGSEKEVLEGNVDWLRSFRWMFIEVHDPLDEQWLAVIALRRLPGWVVTGTERRHSGAFLALLQRLPQSALDTCD